MSWSVTAIGKPAAVLEKVAADFAKIKCEQPEQDVVSRIGATIARALEELPSGCAVKLSASGSGYSHEHGFIQSFTVTFEPIYGFVE